MLTVNGYAATSVTEPLTRTTIDRRDVGPHDVLIEIKYTGICHTDIHFARDEWGNTTYPVVPGHEIAGIVADVGSEGRLTQGGYSTHVVVTEDFVLKP